MFFSYDFNVIFLKLFLYQSLVLGYEQFISTFALKYLLVHFFINFSAFEILKLFILRYYNYYFFTFELIISAIAILAPRSERALDFFT